MAESITENVDMAAEPSLPTKTAGIADATSSSIGPDVLDPLVPVHICAFCACGENSLLGQGPLNRYEATPGFNPFKRVLQKSRRCAGDEEKAGREKSPKHMTWRRPRSVAKGSRERSRSPRQPMSTEEELAASLGSDELANLGYPDDVEVGQVFEPTGHVWAHEACAAWSEGVQTSVDKLQFVDRAVFAGLSQKCNFCKRYGASIVCKAQRCGKTFHYPCAAASGCFQDMKSLSLLCPSHVDQADITAPSAAFCVLCCGGTHIGQLLFCTTCGQHNHGSCLSPEVEVKPVLRAGWQCPNCKVCQSCRQKNVQHLVSGRAGDDNKMLVCDTCDKGYHMYCLKPPMTAIPKNGWKCKNCRACSDCGARTPGSGPSSRWHHNYSVCDSCYQQRNKGLCCPLCSKAYRHFDNKTMVLCNNCKKYVHSECDKTIDNEMLRRLKDSGQTDYICTVCREQGTEMDVGPFPLSSAEESVEGYPAVKDVEGFSEVSMGESTSMTIGSQESIYYEDSSSSLDVDFLSEKALYGVGGKDLYEGPVPSRGKFSSAGKKKFGAGRPRTKLGGERRRTSLSFGEKRRGTKVKVKANPVAVTGQVKEVAATAAVPDNKDDSGDDHPSTIILSRSNDAFVHNHDICKACGSIGVESEKKLIVCTQCGQCYHPYCVSVKVTRVILQKGWRCLDCTVCEGCGSPDDEGRLLLCDDCDISYHTYCLDPPLEHVPKGTWKCKWCVYCVNCGTTTPGVGCGWQQNYTQCGPCASKVVCPSCRKNYREEELVIQCVYCDRWLHAGCDGVLTEDDAERAADYGYHCLFCRPKTGQPGPLPPPPPPPPPLPVEESKPPSPPPIKEPEVPKQYLMDGVYLSASGLQQIQSLTVTMPKKPRQQRKNIKKMEKIEPLSKNPSMSRLMSLSSQEDESLDKDSDELKSMDIPMETGDGASQSSEAPVPSATPAEGAVVTEEVVEEGGTKKRKQRRYVGLGVGGFIARHRARTNFLKRQMSLTSEMSQDGEPAVLSSEGDKISPQVMSEHSGMGEKLKKTRRKPKKSKLEEDLPTYLQEAFFGRDTLDLSKDTVPKKVLSSGSDSDDEGSRPGSPQASAIEVEGEIAKSLQQAKDAALPSTSMTGPPRALTPSQASTGRSEEFDDGDLSDFLGPNSINPDDEDIMQLLGTDFDKDEAFHIDDEALGSHAKLDEGSSKDGLPDSLDQIMSPNFPIDQKMFPEDIDLGAIDMEMLKDVMGNEGPPDQPSTSGEGQFGLSSMPGGGLPPMTRPMQASPLVPSDNLPIPSIPGQAGQMGPMPPQDPMLPGPPHMGMQGPDAQNMPGPSGNMAPHFNLGPQSQFSPNFSPHDSPMSGGAQPPSWPGGGPNMPSPTPGADDEVRETSRRNILKWETDEALGANATISAVLYVNMNYPDLAKEYPEWTERSKQIAKLWKKLTPEEKNPYLAKARKNRTSSRVQKAQKQVAQEMRRRQEAQMRQDSQAMPPPPAPPPLTSPGQMQGDHMFLQTSPEGMRPGMEGAMVGMMSPGSPLHSPGRPPLPGPGPGSCSGLEGSAKTSPGQSPLQSPNQPGSSPFRMDDMQKPFDPLLQSPGGTRHPDSQMHGPPRDPFSPGAGGQTPEGPSRQMSGDPYAFQAGDHFAQPPGRQQIRPPASQPFDPYSQPPGTPRPGTHGEDEFGKTMHQPPFAGRPQQPQPQGDMFMPPPSAPRPGGQIRHGSPMGMMGEGGPRMRPPINDPYAFQPSTPRPSTPQEDPYAQPPGTPRPVLDPMFRGMRPQFPRMAPPPTSDPFQGGQHVDPYSQQPMTPRPGPHMTPGPDMSPNRPQMMSPNKPQMVGAGPSPPYGGGMDQFRHKMVRAQSLPDPFSMPPGTPRPGMDPHMSRSMSDVSQEMGGRMRPHFMQDMGKPAPPMTDPGMSGDGSLGERGPSNIQHQQLREILAQQTKLRMKKQQESEKLQAAAGQQGGHPWAGPDAGPPGALSPGAMPRLPGEGFAPRGMMEEGMRPGFPGPRPPGPGMGMPPRPHLPSGMGGMQQGQPMGPRPGMPFQGQGPGSLPISQADHIPDLDRQRMRQMQMLRQGELSGAMGQPHMGGPGGPMPPATVAPDQGFAAPHPQDTSLPMDMQDRPIPATAADPSAQRAATLQRSDSQAPSHDDEVFRQTPLTSSRDPMISDSKPTASESSDEQGLATQADTDNLQLPDIDVHPKPSLSSEDDKHEDDDLLSADGTFDILKYADPELSHEDMEQDEKMIFDLIDQDEKQRLKDDKEDTNDVDEVERSQDSAVDKSEGAIETDTSEDSKGASSKTSTSGFQSQFLEFSRKRLELMDAEASEASKEKKDDKESKDSKASISHIAALLQSTDPIAARRMRGDDLGGESSGGLLQRGHFQGQGITSPMHPGHSPHHGPPTPMQQSPGGGLHGQNSQSLPSPKVLPSPRSSQPSPHTPGIQSPFNSVSMGQGHSPHSQPVTPGQQLSPFSQSTSVQSPFSPPTSCGQSPFSSTSVSGPQSPFPRTQSPFTMTSQTGGGQVTYGSPQHPGAHPPAPPYSKQSPMRGTSTPTNQYTQGSYSQPLSHMQPKGGPATLSPVPSSILYGQSAVSQQGMRNPNAPFPGSRPPFNMPPGSQSQEMMNQPRPPNMSGERPMGPRSMLPPVSIPGQGAHPPEKGMMSPSGGFPSLQQQLQQGPPPFPGQPRMPPHGMGPRMMGPRPGFPPTSQQGYTLLDDLVEQEKQEQKRQAEKQAFLQRCDVGGKPEAGLPAGPRMGMHMAGMPPMGPRMDHPPRMPGPEGGWAPSTSQAGPPPEMGGQFPPGFPGRPSQQLSPRTPSPFQSPSPGMQPQVMALGPLPPPPPPNPLPGEDPNEYHRQVLQYDEQLTKHGQYLEMQVKLLEQQINKQKRSKKTIQARQRQARKSGNELSSADSAELERISTEQSAMQKQLEQHRKQFRQHQMTVQDYRNKHKDNNPFSEGYQEREAREKVQPSPQLSPSATPQPGPPRMPMHFPGDPQKSPSIPPSPGKDVKSPGQVAPFFRDPGMSFEQGPRFRAPAPFPGEAVPRPEGQRLPSPGGFSGSPGMFPGMPGHQMDPRLPFPQQGMQFQGFGIPPANLPSEVGPAQEQKEKPKKRRKKKKSDESDNAHSQPLPPSMPNQGAPLGQQQASTPTTSEGSTAPVKPPPDLPKPQSETDRRILEILSSTLQAQKSQEQGGIDPNKPAARSPRNKSPASTPGPSQGHGPQGGPGQHGPQGMGPQPQGTQEGHGGAGAPFPPHGMVSGPGHHPGHGPGGGMLPGHSYGPGPGIIRPPPGGLEQGGMARSRFQGMMPHGMHPGMHGGPPMPPRMHPPPSSMHLQGQQPPQPMASAAQSHPPQSAAQSLAPSPALASATPKPAPETPVSGTTPATAPPTSAAGPAAVQSTAPSGGLPASEQAAQDDKGGVSAENSQPTSQETTSKEGPAAGSGEPSKEVRQSQEKPQPEGSQAQPEKSGHTSVLQSYLSGTVPLPSTSHPKTLAEKLKAPDAKSQDQTTGQPPEETAGSSAAAPQTSTAGAPPTEASSGAETPVTTSAPQQSQAGMDQQPSSQLASELSTSTAVSTQSAPTTTTPTTTTSATTPTTATSTAASATTSTSTSIQAGRSMMQGPHPGAMPPYMCFPQRPPFSHLFLAGSLLPYSPHPQPGQTGSNPSVQTGPLPPSSQAGPALVTSTASAAPSQSQPVTASATSAQTTATSSSAPQSTSTAATATQVSAESQSVTAGQASDSSAAQGGAQAATSTPSHTGSSPPTSTVSGSTPAVSTQAGAPASGQQQTGPSPFSSQAGVAEQPSASVTQTATSSAGQPGSVGTGVPGSRPPTAGQQAGGQAGAGQLAPAAQPQAVSTAPASSQGMAGHSGPGAHDVRPPMPHGRGKPGPPRGPQQQMSQAPPHSSQAGLAPSSHAQPGGPTASAHPSQAGSMSPRYTVSAPMMPSHPQAGRMPPGQGHAHAPGQHPQARMSPGYSQAHSFSQAGPMPGHSQAGPMPGHSPTGAFPPGHSQAGPGFPGHSQAGGHLPAGFSQAGPIHTHEGPMVSMHSQGAHMPPGYSQAGGGPPGYPESGNMPPSHSQAGPFPPGHPQAGQGHPGHVRPGHPHPMHAGQMHARFTQQGPMPPGFSQSGPMPPGYSQGMPFHHGHPQGGHMASGPSGGPHPRMPQGMPPGMMQRMPSHHMNVPPSSQMGHFMGDRRMPTPEQMSMHGQRMSPRVPGMAGPGAHPPSSIGHPGYPGQQPMHGGQPGMGPRPGMPHHPMGPVPPGSRPMGHRFPPHTGMSPRMEQHGPGLRQPQGSQASLMLPPTSSFVQSSAATPLASMSGMVTSVPASPTPPHTPVSSTPPQSLHHQHAPTTAAVSLPGASPTFALAAGDAQIKEEPQEKQGADCGDRRHELEEQRIGQNALLKQLLANSNIHKAKGEGAEDSEDSLPQLTPEQQKQLELIDKMPLCKETEISHEEWDSKTPDEKEQIMDQNGKGVMSPSNFPNEQSSGQSHSPTQMRRQEYERRRKEYEEVRKNKKKTAGPLAGGEPKQPTKRKKMKDGKEPVKKRSRKMKGGETEVEAQVEAIFQQLKAMPPVTLKEPDIAPNHNIVPIYGFSVSANDQPRYQLVSDRGLAGMQPPLLSPPGLGPSGMSGGPSPLLPKPRIGPRPAESVKSDSPATVISSSSPECSFNDLDECFPALRYIEPAESTQDASGKMSPTVPLIHPVPYKPEALRVKEEVDADAQEGMLALLGPKRDAMGDLEALVSNAGRRDMSCKTHALSSNLAQTFRESMDQQVQVTVTLKATTNEDLGGVIAAIADLLKIAVPPTYEYSETPTPEMYKMNMAYKEEAVSIQSLMKAKPKHCKHCDVVVLSSGIKRKREELPSPMREDQDWEEEVTFCSMNCCMQFMVSHRPQLPADPQVKEAAAASLVEHKSATTDSTPSASPRTSSVASSPPPTTPVSTPLVIIPPSTASSSSTLSPILPSPPVKTEKEKAGKKHRRSSTTELQTPKPQTKKWKDTRWKRWDPLSADLAKVSPMCEKGVGELWSKIKTIEPKEDVDDTRSCAFCHEVGDGACDGPSRLLNMDVDKYAHLNCALWSSEVYETCNGALIHVDQAFRRSLAVECVWCHKKGASLSCFRNRCGNSYHLPCAQRAGSKFFHDKTVLCPNHIAKTVFSEDNVIPSLVVHRRVYICRDEDRQVAHMIHQGEGFYLRVGSLTLIQIGQLLPHQIQTGKFHSREYIYPVGFKTSRLYWSMRFLFQRCKYICTIEEKEGRPVFTVEVKEPGFEDVKFQEKTPKESWMHAFEPIEKMRREADLVKMFPSFITGEELFGLTEPSIVKVLESLPGTDLLQNYNFRYGRSPLIEMPLAINPTGCARAEPKFRTHFRKPHTLQTSTSRSLPSTVTGVTGDINSPYMKQFVHSKSQQYRRLKTEWKANVFLGRSRIQGLGLFAAKDLEKHTMVIEYIGDLIRNEVANKKEKIYENQNRGVYMFRIDQETVIDATMSGGPARYINHSCAPNCVAEVVPFERESKIIIITNRRIAKGEELTYDYKFDFEDDQHKIPCCCGASVCRKWMN